jgi:hypothetical protein
MTNNPELGKDVVVAYAAMVTLALVAVIVGVSAGPSVILLICVFAALASAVYGGIVQIKRNRERSRNRRP